jgi:hypothetical protein
MELIIKALVYHGGSVNLRKRYSYKPYITYIGTSKAKNQANRYCLWIDYIFTFLVYLIEILQKRYKGLFIVEAMSPSGNGLRNTSQRKYLAKEKRVTSL